MGQFSYFHPLNDVYIFSNVFYFLFCFCNYVLYAQIGQNQSKAETITFSYWAKNWWYINESSYFCLSGCFLHILPGLWGWMDSLLAHSLTPYSTSYPRQWSWENPGPLSDYFHPRSQSLRSAVSSHASWTHWLLSDHRLENG